MAAQPAIAIQELLRNTAQQLQPVAGENAALEARLLAQHAWGVDREGLLRDAQQPVAEDAAQALRDAAARRLQHEPISHIVGYRDFWKDRFAVTRDVLTPRPDSETMIEALTRQLPPSDAPHRVLDLGTGTGCLMLSVLREYPHATGVAVDASPAALKVAQHNADALGLAARVQLRQGDWCAALDSGERFAIVVTNPPYIARAEIAGLAEDVKGYEPHLALDGGQDGLDCYRTILSTLPAYLDVGARVLVEVGAGQAEDVAALGVSHGLRHEETCHDLAGIARIVCFTSESNQG